MRTATEVAGAVLIGALLVFGCNSSDSDVANTGGAAGMASPTEGGAAGVHERASAGGAAGGAGAPLEASDGPGESGAGGACGGNYACPAVSYASSARFEVNLPISVADAANALFTACRNSECHSAKGSASVDPNDPTFGWQEGTDGGLIQLSFDGSGSTPFATLEWVFYDGPTSADEFSLTIEPGSAATPITLFDKRVTYTTKVVDPSLVSEGYCRHCSEVSVVNLDLRPAK
jgi:hypothetical protein